MMERLKEMQEKHSLIGDIRGKGVFLALELVKDRETKEPAVEEAELVAAKAMEKGLLLNLNYRKGYGNVLKMKPPLTIEEDLIGGASYEKHKKSITDEVFYKALESEIVILGACGGPKWNNLEF